MTTTAEILALALARYQPNNARDLAEDLETETWLLILRDSRDNETLGMLRHEPDDTDEDAGLDDAEAWSAVAWVDLRNGHTYAGSTAAYVRVVHTAGIATGSVRRVKPRSEFSCAECGVSDATTYVVTTLDPNDLTTRTEVCLACHAAISNPA